MVILTARIQDSEFNTFASSLLTYKFIIYRSPNNPNQSKFLIISPSTNTHSGYTVSKETLSIFHPTSPTSPYLTKSDLYNIQNEIKSMTDKHHFDMKTLTDHISAILAKITVTSSKTYKKEQQLTNISSKLSTYEDRLEKLIIA